MTEDTELLKEINEKLTTLTALLPLKLSESLVKKLNELKDVTANETPEDTIWRLIHFHDFYMEYFEVIRNPESVKITKEGEEYTMQIELPGIYCGQILHFTDFKFKELE